MLSKMPIKYNYLLFVSKIYLPNLPTCTCLLADFGTGSDLQAELWIITFNLIYFCLDFEEHYWNEISLEFKVLHIHEYLLKSNSKSRRQTNSIRLNMTRFIDIWWDYTFTQKILITTLNFVAQIQSLKLYMNSCYTFIRFVLSFYKF